MTANSPVELQRRAAVLIVDDHPIVREGLAMHIAAQSDLEVRGEAEDLPGALALLGTTRFDVAIVDISLRDGNGLDLVRRIAALDSGIRTLIWSMYPGNLYAERALRAGALGYLNKGEATHHVLEAVRAVLQGRFYLSENLANRVMKRALGHQFVVHSPVDSLTDRELEAFQFIGEGLTTEAIAKRMHVSPKTVETFRSRIKEKLGLCNINELIQRACQWVVESQREGED